LIARPALLRSAAVVRFRLWLAIAFALGAIIGSVLRAQVSDEETPKGEQSVKKHHKAHTSSPAPEKSPSPIAKAKPVSNKFEKGNWHIAGTGGIAQPDCESEAVKKIRRRRNSPKIKTDAKRLNQLFASARRRNHRARTPKAQARKKNQPRRKHLQPQKKAKKGKAKASSGRNRNAKA